MDELEISGKRYLSSRRAAKQYNYHSDYIGQLIRAGKVEGTKVGRAWYVEAVSLKTYLGQDSVGSQAEFSGAPQPVRGVVYIGRAPVGETSVAPAVVVAPQIQKKALTYIPDNEPLIPEIYPEGPLSREKEIARTPEEPIYKKKEGVVVTSLQNKNSPKAYRVVLLAIASGFVLLGSMALFTSTFVAVTLTVEQGKPASVVYFFK